MVSQKSTWVATFQYSTGNIFKYIFQQTIRYLKDFNLKIGKNQ